MYAGEEIHVIGSWFRIHFLENEGMAYGLAYGGALGKIILTVFRLIALVAIGYYLSRLIKRNAATLFIVCMSLIFAGALGNIIDSVFYGLLFEASDIFHPNIAQFLPSGGGYAPLLKGKVVDMLYFPIIRGQLPHWLPIIGGNVYSFFNPVFNIADAAISSGVFSILLFYRKIFDTKENKSKPFDADNAGTEIESN